MQKPRLRSRRSVSAFSLFEKSADLQESIEHSLSSVVNDYETNLENTSTSGLSSQKDLRNPKQEKIEKEENSIPPTILVASDLGDFPAQYEVYSLEKHQFPVIGVYIDKRIIPGFKYRVRRLTGSRHCDVLLNNCREKYLFHGKSSVLLSIGRGYARRFTFENNKDFPEEENHFYSDNNIEGYAFEPQAVSDGEKYTIYNVNHEPNGVLEIIKADMCQIEMSSESLHDRIERRLKVKLIAKVEFYDSGVSQQISIDGTAICTRRKNQGVAETMRIVDVNIKHHRYYLVPGHQEYQRRVYIKGEDIGDVPTKYTITGLSSYEIPVIGTYIDPRILPGFNYRVRPINRKRHLFQGKTLRLQSVGQGYAKKMTFESASHVHSNNYLWSDNHHDGLAFEPRGVNENMKFLIAAGNQILGEAKVFRANLPQREERMEKVKTSNNQYSYIKYIHVDVMCHVRLDINESGTFNNENLMRVYGLAVVRKDPDARDACLERVENVGLDSQLNIIFASTQTELIFLPIK